MLKSKKANILTLRILTFYVCGLDGTRTRDLRRDRAAF